METIYFPHILFGRNKGMPHIPSKESMIAAVRKSGCSNLTHLPLEVMTAEQIYAHLVAAKCPCLQKLLAKEKERD